MTVDVPQYRKIVEAFRAQPAGKRPNFRQASRDTGIHVRTLLAGWETGWPSNRRRPALPPIKDVFAPAPPTKSRASVSDQALESVETLLTISNSFIKTISEVAPQIRGSLIERATSEPDKATSQLNELLKVVESAARSGERLASMGRALMDHRSSPSGDGRANGTNEGASNADVPASTPAAPPPAEPTDVAARIAAELGEDAPAVTPGPAVEGVAP